MDDRLPGLAAPLRGRFIARPNRFLVHCRLSSGRRVKAFLPNPGRLRELLLPGAVLHLQRSGRRSGAAAVGRKTACTVIAAERDGDPVPLHTGLANRVARLLVERNAVPSLEGARVVRAEVPVGNSRFDFLLEHRGGEVLLEVKSCTLFGNGVAMFPDAVTDRGRRHLEELYRLARPRRRSAVLFLVHTPRARWFMPDYHTDPAFARTLLAVRHRVRVLPLALSWAEGLRLEGVAGLLPVPWRHVSRESADRGGYLLLLHLGHRRRLTVGRLGEVSFPAGHYLYVGSVLRNLEARIARHLRRRKRMHWHIDYLREAADSPLALPIRSSRREECALAAALEEVFEPGPPGFGSSDCRCPTHLFYSKPPPLDLPRFHDVLQRFRMRHPE